MLRGEREPIIVDPRSSAISAVLAALLAGLILLGTATLLTRSRADVNKLAYGDGLIYRYVATHLDAKPNDVDPVVSSRGTSLRYGRVGLPALIWIGSLGRAEGAPYAQAVIMVLAAAAAGAAAAALIPSFGFLAGLLPFLAPGFPLSVSGGFAEALAVALALWATLLVSKQRWLPAILVLSLLVLTRENGAAVLGALMIWTLLRGHWKHAIVLGTAALPAAVWFVVVESRYGHIPPLDPYLRTTTETVGPPFVALVRSFTHAASGASMVTALIHVALAVVAVVLARRSILGLVAAVTGLQLIITGPFAWEIVGEAWRTPVFLQVFVILAVVAAREARASGRLTSPTS